jgi:cell division protein FtsW (lipid II flippase)
MTTSTMVGSRALALAELLFGREPAHRYVAPAVADWQAAHQISATLAGRAALRLRYTLTLAASFFFMTSRTEGDGALARLWPAALASILGVLVLRQPGVRPALVTQQLVWLGIGIAVFLALAAARRRIFDHVGAVSIATALAGVALLVSGNAWWRVPIVGLVVSPAELLKVPALVLAVSAATGAKVTRLVASGALALACVGLLRTEEPQAVAVILATVAGALWTVLPASRRPALVLASALVAAALFAAPARSYPAPDPHTDHIALSTMRAFGMPGVLVLGAALGAMFYLLAGQARRERGASAASAAALFTGMVVQIAIHLAGELGMGPVLGVPLPLATYGGSATVATYAALGIALAARRRAEVDAYGTACTAEARSS